MNSEDDTFERLRRTTYRVVWERCRTHSEIDDVNERCELISATKRHCGWTDEEFRIEWDRHWSDWETYERR